MGIMLIYYFFEAYGPTFTSDGHLSHSGSLALTCSPGMETKDGVRV